MLYSYFFNMLKVGVPWFTQVPQLLVYNLIKQEQPKLAAPAAFQAYFRLQPFLLQTERSVFLLPWVKICVAIFKE